MKNEKKPKKKKPAPVPIPTSTNTSKKKEVSPTTRPPTKVLDTINLSSDEEKPLDLSKNQGGGSEQEGAQETGKREIKKEHDNSDNKVSTNTLSTCPKPKAKDRKTKGEDGKQVRAPVKPVQAPVKPVQAPVKPVKAPVQAPQPKVTSTIPPPADPRGVARDQISIDDQSARAAKITKKNLARLTQHQAQQTKFTKDDEAKPMRVTVDSSETKQRIIDAAMFANLWGHKHKATFFRDIPPVKKSENRKRRRSSKEDMNMSKKSKTEVETPKSSRSQRTSPSTSKGDPRRNIRNDSLWHRPDEDISQTIETPKEELEGIKLHKLDSRRCERSSHEDGQEKVATREGKKKEKPSLLITSFTAINESKDENENKTEESMGEITPLWKDTKPELYNDHIKLGFPTGRDSATFRDSGTGKTFLSRDKGTTGQKFLHCPGTS